MQSVMGASENEADVFRGRPEVQRVVTHGHIRRFRKPQAMPLPLRRLNHVLRRGDRPYAVGTSRPEGLAVRTARREIATRKFGALGSK